MFVVGTCAADIIGEDIAGLCNQLQPDIKAKLVPLMAVGFGAMLMMVGDGFGGFTSFYQKKAD
ncbi:MAG: hypothetical protein ACYTXI_26605 [Nostoc sp.]